MQTVHCSNRLDSTSVSRSLTVIATIVLVVCGGLSPASAQQQEERDRAIEIEPYDGPPIFLPEVEPPPPPTEVESQVIKRTYEGTETPRFERRVVRYSDDSLKSDGPMKEYFRNGQLFVDGQYKVGKPVGEWTYYHKNGQVAKVVPYTNGRIDGTVQAYNEEGKLVAERSFGGGKRDGSWKYYDSESDQVLREEKYVSGKAEGEWRTFYKNGQMRQLTTFVAGKLEGSAKEWTRLGEPRAIAEFKDGKRHGKTTLYQADGSVVERLYDEGQLVDQTDKSEDAS